MPVGFHGIVVANWGYKETEAMCLEALRTLEVKCLRFSEGGDAIDSRDS
jgi:hypothetical protein